LYCIKFPYTYDHTTSQALYAQAEADTQSECVHFPIVIQHLMALEHPCETHNLRNLATAQLIWIILYIANGIQELQITLLKTVGKNLVLSLSSLTY